MWTEEEVAQIENIARRERPGIRVFAIPRGLQLREGPEGVVEFLVKGVPGWLDGFGGSRGEGGVDIDEVVDSHT
jgi:hypothetical protein